MISLVRKLEPRHEKKGTIIYRTVEDVEEVFFIDKGSIDIGFEINRESKFVLRLGNGGVVGAYNITFGSKTVFIYKVSNLADFEGFTIRKDNWN
jgi:hypothetical protein